MSGVPVPKASVLDAQHGVYKATDEEKDWRPNGCSKATTPPRSKLGSYNMLQESGQTSPAS